MSFLVRPLMRRSLKYCRARPNGSIKATSSQPARGWCSRNSAVLSHLRTKRSRLVSARLLSRSTPTRLLTKTALLSNYPNPFNPETWIPYQLAEAGNVTVTIYDIRGIVIRQLVVGHQPMGNYRSRSRAVHWDGRNQFGEKVATGLYFYTLKVSGDFTATRKMLVYK